MCTGPVGVTRGGEEDEGPVKVSRVEACCRVCWGCLSFDLGLSRVLSAQDGTFLNSEPVCVGLKAMSLFTGSFLMVVLSDEDPMRLGGG